MARLTDDRCINDLCGQASKMLFEYGKRNVKKELKNRLKKLAGRGYSRKDLIFWPAGMLLLGLLEAGKFEEVATYLDNWISKGAAVINTDDALTGYVLVRMYEVTGNTKYKEAADRIAEFLFCGRKDAAGSIVYNARRENSYIFADGAGQSAMFLSHYGRVFDNKEAGKLAAQQLLNFKAYGMDEKSKLPYHGYDHRSKVKYGIIGWGRAVGWLLFGTSQYIQDLVEAGFDEQGITDPEAKEIVAMNETLIRTALEYADIREDGLFAWQLSCTEGPADTSACGMIFYACAKTFVAGKGFESLLTDEERKETGKTKAEDIERKNTAMLGERLADAAYELGGYINGGRVMQCSAECEDFAQYRQKYSCYPWGQGSVLAFLAKM